MFCFILQGLKSDTDTASEDVTVFTHKQYV